MGITQFHFIQFIITMRKILLTLSFLCLGALSAFADLPFRNHRYDAFKVLKITPEHTVFVGNSITNMHEWWEAFGNPKIINRGVSGAVSNEMLANLESVVAGRPKQIFFMIGTNDLGTAGLNTAAQVARNVRTTLKRCQLETPETQLFVQSILPSRQRNLALQKETNDSLKKICTEMKVTYIDLWNDLLSVSESNNNSHTLDGVHLTASGYRIWCNKIARYVGSECVYPASAPDNACNLGGSYGMRATYFSMLPVCKDDILLIGDATIHGGEWHELLHSDKVKSRGTGWGYPGPDIATIKKMVSGIFKGRSDNEEPAQIYLYIGTADLNNTNKTVDAVVAEYRTLVGEIRKQAPNAPIYVQAILPKSDAASNTNRIVPFNTKLQALVKELANVEYIDCYTPFVKEGMANPAYFSGNYLYGKGYAKLSQLLAKTMGAGIIPTSDEEANINYAVFNQRTELGDIISRAEGLKLGNEVGAYTPEAAADLLKALPSAYMLLSKQDATGAELAAMGKELNALMTTLLPKLNLPKASTADNETWYQLYTPNRENRYLTSNGTGKELTGNDKQAYARMMWKFVSRTDGTFDIINREDSGYVSPTANFNAAVSTSATAPAQGWELSYSNTAGLFIIRSGKVQLNQTQKNLNYALYNWSSGQDGLDREDAGCQFAIVNAPAVIPEPHANPIAVLDSVVLDGTMPYAVPADVASEIFKHKSVTVAIDFTPKVAPAQPAMLFASSNSKGQDYFGVVTRETNKYGLQYVGNSHKEGWYTWGGKDLTKRSQIVITMNGETETYHYYFNGKADRSVSGMGEYGYRTFGNVPNVDGLYLGGVVRQDKINEYPFAGTIHSVRIWDRVLTADEVASLTYGKEDLPEGTYQIDMAHGKFVKSNQNGTWHQVWQSDVTNPVLQLDASHNNMTKDDQGNILAYVGQYSPENYALIVPVGYAVTGFSFDVINHEHNDAIEVACGTTKLITSNKVQHFAVSGLKEQTATFTLKGVNKGLKLTNFHVTVAKGEYIVEEQFEVFPTLNSTAIPYRIPGIATAKNGDVIAVADYRHSRSDIGFAGSANGRIDLHARVSHDNGKTWDDITTIVEGQGKNATDLFYTGFGDPCIVADRETNDVLVLSCSGDISFPSGTREHHQGIARFISTDFGKTWSAPTNLAESIYSQFDNSKRGPIRSMFIGSGKIHQSRYTKVGSHYRLYCAALVRDVNATMCNYVLYSDDFGANWKVLGGTDNAPIPSGADEPKAEELPDGSVVISSRCNGGRYYNVYSFTSAKKAEGSWGTVAFSGKNNNGVTAEGNSCNGEIMILPVTRRADNKPLYLALQSLPFGSGRANVGVYYKELASYEDFCSADSLAANWEGRHQASRMSSAYSTMTLQADSTIGFVYEEDTHRTNGGGYTIVYKNYSLEHLTDSLYSVRAEEGYADWIKACGERKVEIISEQQTGDFVGMYDRQQLSLLKETGAQCVTDPSPETYEQIQQVASSHRIALENGAVYMLQNKLYPSKKLALNENLTEYVGKEGRDDYMEFVFTQDEAGNWKVYNEKYNKWLGVTGQTEERVPATTKADAATYEVTSSATGFSVLSCTKPGNGGIPAIHLAAHGHVVPWTSSADASMWQICKVGMSTDLDSVLTPAPAAQPTRIYDLQGRLVKKPVLGGVYIVNGRKKLVK